MPREKVTSIEKAFRSIQDPRASNRKHKIQDILAISLCAVLCGAEGWEDIEEFGRSNEKWFCSFLELRKGIPSHDTISRLFMLIDPEEFGRMFIEWVKGFREEQLPQGVSIDGKTLRSSFDKAAGKSPIHMVSAWAHESGMVLGHQKIHDKSNEIVAIPQLIALLDLKGCTVTIDAMGCQKKIASAIREAEADYVLQLKANHPSFFENVKYEFRQIGKMLGEGLFFETQEKLHGRFETRKYWVINELNDLPDVEKWKDLSTIIKVSRTREIDNEISEETSYYLSSKALSAEEAAKYIRNHWGIENKLHWVLDVAFNEDNCNIRKDNAPQNLAIIRHMTVNMLKNEKSLKKGVKAKRKKAGWDRDYLLKVLCS